MSEPHDQSARLRFATELDRNFSVVASAGSGKTRAVTDRIVALARSSNALAALPRLVVLTFANRAADEMQQRAREEIMRQDPGADILAAFNQAWFGTIHSFCFRLLNEHGHHLGLPAPLGLVTDDEDLWNEFVQQQARVGRSLADESRAALLQLASLRHIMELGRSAGSALLHPAHPGPRPDVDLAPLHQALAGVKRSETVANSIAQLRMWEEGYRAGAGFLRWPICFTKAQKIDGLWAETFAPLRRWVNQAAICVAAEVQRDYRNFRLERGVVTYADQIALADELLQHPEAARRLRQLDPIIILDEAQDTDPAQFSVLLEMTRPPEATGRWLETRVDPPRPGRFCMVGDFQQSIWHERADLPLYRRVHDALVAAESGGELTFSVTFRLDQRQIDFVNETFREILHGATGQVDYVTLQPRPGVLPGQVIRLSFDAGLVAGMEKPKDREVARAEARELARWLKKSGPAKLRARSWREVAILCPRKDWLRTMAFALREAGLPTEVQSESDLQADSPAYAWLTALCVIMVEPRNGYELVGVLREVHGLSDHDLAQFSEGIGERFQIETPVAAAGRVSSTIAALAALRASVLELPLFAAVTQIVEQTALRERLALLPETDFNNPLGDLATLLTLAAEAGAAGATLADFADQLRAEMERPRPVRLSDENAIQLITAQKAKGSEWDAVILPFLGRRIIPPSPRYPSLIRVPGSNEVIAALHKEDREEDIKEAYNLLRRQEMERLLYVAFTRARHTLVLALDRPLFSPKTGRAADYSQLKFLRGDVGDTNTLRFESLPEKALACAATGARQASPAAATPAALPGLAPLDQSAVENARVRAARFVRKQNPSGFEPLAELPPGSGPVAARSLMDNPATLYGGWWHALFQHFPWQTPPRDWQKAFDSLQPGSPQPERSLTEWELFRKAWKDSPIASFLAKTGATVRTEHPFLWHRDASNCVEGVIDLLVHDPEGRRCLLVDWKTNRITRGEESRLLERYRPQMAAYREAIRRLTGNEVTTALYATATGSFLLYQEQELEREWERLAALSAGASPGVFPAPAPA